MRSSLGGCSTANERGREVFQGYSCLTGGPRVICGSVVALAVIQDVPWTEFFQLRPHKLMNEDGTHCIFRGTHHGSNLFNVKGSLTLEKVYLCGLLLFFVLLLVSLKPKFQTHS